RPPHPARRRARRRPAAAGPGAARDPEPWRAVRVRPPAPAHPPPLARRPHPYPPGALMRPLLGIALGLGLAGAAAPAPAAETTNCKFGNEMIAPGKAMCLNGFATECRPNGAWAVNRQAPCFSGVTTKRVCTVSPVE